MTTSDIIKELFKKQNIYLAEPCRRIDQTSQNFNKKLKRKMVFFDNVTAIAESLGARYG